MTKYPLQNASPASSTHQESNKTRANIRREKALKINNRLKKLFPGAKIVLNFKTPIELFVAVVLSAQTTDKQVNIVTNDLFGKYKTLRDYVDAPLSQFEGDIKRIGLYRSKAKNIKAALEIIDREHNGKLPDSMNELIKLPGVGRKTANVLIYNIYGKSEGIAVDTHVKRLSNLFGLTQQSNSDKIERDLMILLPKSEWGNFTYGMIDYGRAYCPARCKHQSCPFREYIV